MTLASYVMSTVQFQNAMAICNKFFSTKKNSQVSKRRSAVDPTTTTDAAAGRPRHKWFEEIMSDFEPLKTNISLHDLSFKLYCLGTRNVRMK